MAPAGTQITVLDTPRGNSLAAEIDIPPLWRDLFIYRLPFIGPFLSLFGEFLRYNTTLEDNADFIAANLTNDRFVGHRVGVINDPKGKQE